MATIAVLTPRVLAGTLCLGWAGLTAAAGGHNIPDRRPQFHQLGVVSDAQIKESSGLARCYANPGSFWTHNDAGGEPRLFLLGPEGKTSAVVRIRGARMVDWEDIASFRQADCSYVLIGDVGDNDQKRSATHDPCTLYVIKEPHLGGATSRSTGSVDPVSVELTLQFVYPDGPHNCESVAVDANSGKVYLASKEKRHRLCQVYELPLPAAGLEQPAVARRIAAVPIETAVAMDIAPDGHRAVILAKRGDRAFEFSRRSGQTWAAALSGVPQEILLPARRQGEAICYGQDGRTLFLTSEGRQETFWEVLR
jgi:hypothetical protein